MAKYKRKRRLGIDISFRKFKLFSLLIAILVLPLIIFMSTNTDEVFEVRSQAAINNDIDSIDVKIEKNKKEKKDKENTVLLIQRKELMKELGYAYPEEFLKKVKTKEEKEKYPKEQQYLIEEKVQKKDSLGRVILDDFNNKVSETDYTMGSENEVYQISFVKEPIEEELGEDNTIDLNGYQLDELIVTDEYELSTDSQVLGSSSIGTKNFVVLPVNFQDDRSKPVTKAEIREKIFCDPSCTDKSVKRFYKSLSNDQLIIQGDVLDYWETNLYKNDICDGYFKLADRAKNQRPELFDGRYYGIVFVHPKVSCYWAGMASLGKSDYGPALMWINDFSMQTLPHEFGHNFGIHHASQSDCVNDPYCINTKEYDDYSDDMGLYLANFNGPHLLALGFKPYTIMNTVSSTGEYRVNRMSGGTNPKIIRVDVPNTSADFYIEYRGGKYKYDDYSNACCFSSGAIIYKWTGVKSAKTFNLKFNQYNTYITLENGETWRTSGYRFYQSFHNEDYAIVKVTKL